MINNMKTTTEDTKMVWGKHSDLVMNNNPGQEGENEEQTPREVDLTSEEISIEDDEDDLSEDEINRYFPAKIQTALFLKRMKATEIQQKGRLTGMTTWRVRPAMETTGRRAADITRIPNSKKLADKT